MIEELPQANLDQHGSPAGRGPREMPSESGAVEAPAADPAWARVGGSHGNADRASLPLQHAPDELRPEIQRPPRPLRDMVDGELIVVSRQPYHSGARKLIELGHSPDTLLRMYPDARAFPLSWWARWTVHESDRRGLKLAEWQPFGRSGGLVPSAPRRSTRTREAGEIDDQGLRDLIRAHVPKALAKLKELARSDDQAVRRQALRSLRRRRITV